VPIAVFCTRRQQIRTSAASAILHSLCQQGIFYRSSRRFQSHVGAALCLCGSVPPSPRPVCQWPFLPLISLGRRAQGKLRRGVRCLHSRAPVMEQIETQASDLRYLTAPVGALSDSASVSYETPQSRPQMSPGSAMYGDNSALQPGGDSPGNANAGASKRKSIEDGAGIAKQTRSKRNRVSEFMGYCLRLVRCVDATRGASRP
jgi:hypothetical protein